MRSVPALLVLLVSIYGCGQQTDDQPVKSGSSTPDTTIDPAVIAIDTAGSIEINVNPNYPSLNPNAGSSIRRRWITVSDTSLPVEFVGITGVTVSYHEGGSFSDGNLTYEATFTVTPSDSIAAFEVHYILFDVWGDYLRTVGGNTIRDLGPSDSTEYSTSWRVYDSDKARQLYASIGYISRVRTKNGQIVEAATDPVVEQARRFVSTFEPHQLNPEASVPDTL